MNGGGATASPVSGGPGSWRESLTQRKEEEEDPRGKSSSRSSSVASSVASSESSYQSDWEKEITDQGE